jgi:putative ATP-binding cassette transporter
MNATAMNEPKPAPKPDELANSGLMSQLDMMARALWTSPVRNALLALAVAVCAVVAVTAYGQIRLNAWNQPFYDALSHHDLEHFVEQLGVFGVIAGCLLALNVGQRWLTETLKWKLRQGLVQDLVEHWMQPGRAFRLANAGAIGVNPDQRMHEDSRHLTELSADLGIGLFQSSILLISFVKVLWDLSSNFLFHAGAHSFTIPGYMVWAAVLYAGSASLLSYWVGRSLIERNAIRYGREADLRYSLVRVNEHIDAIALSGGEADETRRIELDLGAVLQATRRLVTGLTNLTWITAGYGWFTLVAPILVAAPLYFGGVLSFGGLMLAAGAFTQVQSSLRWFVDNFSTIADWRATLLRVAVFRRAIIEADELHGNEKRISFVEGKPGEVRIEDLEIISPAGCTRLEEKKVEIHTGDRVLVVGESGTGKTLLFRTLAGLWPWGEGRVTHPKGEEVAYMPRTPYLPPGTLREVLAYPSAVGKFEDGAYQQALKKVGLERMAAMLNVSKRWDHELNEDEQQTLAFARIVLHAPPWILIDEAIESLDEDSHAHVVDVIEKDLKGTGIVYIGRPDSAVKIFNKTLHLVRDSQARKLARPTAPQPGVQPARAAAPAPA